MKATIFTLLAGMFFAPAYGQGQQRRFDLKGDMLGESLATFKANHPRASCRNISETELSCVQRDASFAGHNPYIYYEKEGDCLDCGLGADFLKGRLTFISYSVSNTEGYAGSVFELLTAKFGKPTSHSKDDYYEFARWASKQETLSLTVVTKEAHPAITVTLKLAKSPNDKDI